MGTLLCVSLRSQLAQRSSAACFRLQVYHLAPNSAKHGPSHKLVLSCSLQGHDDIVASVQSRAAAGSAAPGQEADLTLATGSRDGSYVQSPLSSRDIIAQHFLSFVRSVKVWDANKPAAAQGRFLGHYGPVNAVAWQPSTPGSNLLASAGDDGRVLLWDLRSQAGPAAVAPIRLTSDAAGNGSVVSERGSLRPSTGHGDVALTSLAWITPTQLAAGAADGSVMLLDARNINAVVTRVLSGVHKGGVHALLAGGLTADATDAGVTFFSGGDDGCVQRLEVGEDVSKGDTWPAPVQVAKYSEYVRALAPLPGSDNTVLVGSWDGKLRKLASA